MVLIVCADPTLIPDYLYLIVCAPACKSAWYRQGYDVGIARDHCTSHILNKEEGPRREVTCLRILFTGFHRKHDKETSYLCFPTENK
jgi:hypothetical protein